MWGAWGMLDAAMTGDVPHEAAWQMSRFDYLRRHPDEARVFDEMMARFPDDRHAAIAAAYDFSSARLIADIGGGNGATLRHILARFPGPRGLVFDRPDVVDGIGAEQLMDGRIAVERGSFFDRLPEGADVYLLVRVLHNWPDEDCVRILRACRAAMAAEALLLLGESILEPDPAQGRVADYLLDAQMMVSFGHARHRSVDEFRALLDAADLAVRRIIPTASSISIVEGMPKAI
jgi:SAM-dependent methyltransferase